MSKRAILGLSSFKLVRDRRKRVDPVRRSLENAPIDDEPLTPEDIEAIEEAKAETGPFLSLAEVRAALAARRRG